jgi:hypothetical protein
MAKKQPRRQSLSQRLFAAVAILIILVMVLGSISSLFY